MAILQNATRLSILINLTLSLLYLQPRGVMVAQLVLVQLAEVRILAGLPFFYSIFLSPFTDIITVSY